MVANRRAEIKKALAALETAGPAAALSFRQALPSLSILVYDKIVVEAEYCDEGCPPEKLRIVREACAFAGGLLAAAYELGLYEALADEFAWYAALLSNRGFDDRHVRDTLATWIDGIYFKVSPSASAELSRPLELLVKEFPSWSAFDPPENPPAAASPFIEIMLDGRKREAADYVVSLLADDAPLEDVIDDVLLPTLREIGNLWHAGRIGVAEEHAAAEICRDVIGALPSAAPAGEIASRQALISCVPGEEHELGAKFMAAYLESKGWRVYYLGRGLPAEDIARAAATRNPDVVFLAVTMVAQLPAARETAAAVRGAYPAAKVILAGRAALLARKKFADLAEGFAADIRSGYAAAEELAG